MSDPPYSVRSGELNEPLVMAETPLGAFKKAFVLRVLEEGLPRLGRFVEIVNIQSGERQDFITVAQVLNPALFLALVENIPSAKPHLPKKLAPPPPPPTVDDFRALVRQWTGR